MELGISVRKISKLIFASALGAIMIGAGQVSAEDQVSIYDLKGKWRNIEDAPVGVSVAKGANTLIAMVYTGCAHACPMTISKLQDIETALAKAGHKDVQFVLASFDVKNDRPERLKKYQASRKLDPSRWHFLAAEREEDARELAVALGISYKDIGNGDFSHSNVITLLNPTGTVLATIDNLNASPEPFLKALSAKTKGKKKGS